MAEEVVGSPAEEVIAVPAEGTTSVEAQKLPADQAPAAPTDGQDPDKPDQSEKRGLARVERRLAKISRERAEEKARADFVTKQFNELQASLKREPTDPGAPKLVDFNFDEEAHRLALEKHVTEKLQKEQATKAASYRQEQRKQALTQSWDKAVARGDSKYEDFDEIVGELTGANPVEAAIMEADNAEEIAYYLATHRDEALKIAALTTEIAQVRAIGKLEAKLAAEPPKPKTPSNAPAPITPANGKAAVAKDPSDMTDREFAQWRRKQIEQRA